MYLKVVELGEVRKPFGGAALPEKALAGWAPLGGLRWVALRAVAPPSPRRVCSLCFLCEMDTGSQPPALAFSLPWHGPLALCKGAGSWSQHVIKIQHWLYLITTEK